MDTIVDLNLIDTGLKAMAMLFLVVALLVSVLYSMKKVVFLKKGTRGDLSIKSLSSFHLSPKERIEVIEISGERIVLGITPGHISFLLRLKDLSGEAEETDAESKAPEAKG